MYVAYVPSESRSRRRGRPRVWAYVPRKSPSRRRERPRVWPMCRPSLLVDGVRDLVL